MAQGDTTSFVKMNGLGNEIVVVDLRGAPEVFTGPQARAVAARPEARFDQLMVLHEPRTPGTEAFIRIYNRDGSEAEACGNGMRCVGWIVGEQTRRKALKFETVAGVLDVTVAGLERITVDMGRPRFAWNEIPLAEPFHDTKAIELQIGPIEKPILHSPSAVNVGNPHVIFWVDDVEAFDLGRFGPMLERHPMFPEGANISLVRVTARNSMTVRTWERGAGLTLACGSAACAAVVCGARGDRSDRAAIVRLPGGSLEIEWTSHDRVLMTGPIQLEHRGRLSSRTLEVIAV